MLKLNILLANSQETKFINFANINNNKKPYLLGDGKFDINQNYIFGVNYYSIRKTDYIYFRYVHSNETHVGSNNTW